MPPVVTIDPNVCIPPVADEAGHPVGWVMIYLAQDVLVASGRVELHRRLAGSTPDREQIECECRLSPLRASDRAARSESMKLFHPGAIVGVALAASACGNRCEPLSRADALQIAKEAKAGMLGRSADDYAANFRSDQPVFVRIGAETNGYAANVGFTGRNGAILIALIEGDCYVGWTSRTA